mgnify:CR=1 FL=1
MNTNLTCFLCRDSDTIMYKICDCVESTICIDCYDIDSTQLMNKCGICRKKYEYSYNRNMCKYIKQICINFGLYIILFLSELSPILYLYFYIKHDYLTNVFLIYGLFSITIGNIINNHFLNTLIDNPYNRTELLNVYTFIKLLYIIIIFLIIIYNNDNNDIYLNVGIILCLIYTGPLIFFSSISFIRILENILNTIKINTSNKNIKIRSTIYQTILDNPINNV